MAQPQQYPPIQVYETISGIPINPSILFNLNPDFPVKLLYTYVFNGADGPGAGFVGVDYRFLVNEMTIFSLPYIYNTTTNGTNRFTGGLPNPPDPLWPGDQSLFGWSNVGSTASTDNQIIFTPNNNGVTNGPFSGESNRTNLSPFKITIPANRLRLQLLGEAVSATFRFWTAVIQLPL